MRILGYEGERFMDVLLKTVGGEREFTAQVVQPGGRARGCVVVLHEAFGLTPHILRVCEGFAADGYVAIAPALLSFASGEAEGVVMPQTQAGLLAARDMIEATPEDEVQGMVAACVAWGKNHGHKVALLGYCWGGSVAYAGATRVADVDGCVVYYGGQMAHYAALGQPVCPTLVHLARLDRYIPVEAATAALALHHPAAEVHVYEADHGFNRDDGVSFDPVAAASARERTMKLLENTIG